MHRIRLNMTPEQGVYFNRAAGIARQAWNTALDIYKSYKQEHLKADWNEIKKDYRRRIDTEFPWVREVTKCAPETAIADLRQSISTYYKAKKTLGGNKAALKKLRFPSIRSKKKKIGGFGLANDKFYTAGHEVYIPKLGMVNMTESLRFEGKIMSGQVKEQSGSWFITIRWMLRISRRPIATLRSELILD